MDKSNFHFDIEQGTDAWRAVKAGKVSASKISDIMSHGRGGKESAGRKNYRAQLVAERLSGNVEETFTSGPMMWGVENEDSARKSYQFDTGNQVDQVGFIDHPTIPMAGASPDGLIAEDGNQEIKCPNTATHIEYLIKNTVPSVYVDQIQWQMACSGADWTDFVSYDPRLGVELQLLVIRTPRDQGRIDEIEAEVIKFLAEVDDMVESMNIMIKRRA